MSEEGLPQESRMAVAVARGIGVAVPVAILGLTLGIWLITELDPADSFAASLLPGVLLGVFFGGFVGTLRTMSH